MPTVSRPQPHEHRRVAESFGVDPDRYDRARLGYPDDLVARIVAASPGPDVLNVGCGTGIEARQFQAAGCTVLGVEPDARMAAFARERGLPVEVSTFEDWPDGGRRFDAVVAGTAWHWVDPRAGAVKAATVLRPGGRIALFWHAMQLPAEIQEAFLDVYRRVAPDSPFAMRAGGDAIEAYRQILDTAAAGMRQAAAFTEPEHWRYDWEHTYTRDEWLDQMPTQGTLTRLPADAVRQVLDGVGAAIDRLGGSFTMPYATMAVTAVRAATWPGP